MDITQPYEVPSGRVARGGVQAPPSKSHAIRLLVIGALRTGEDMTLCCPVLGPWPDDFTHACEALHALGYDLSLTPYHTKQRRMGFSSSDVQLCTVHVPALVRFPARGAATPRARAIADVGGSGTALRFLSCVAALSATQSTLTGDASLRARPAGAVVDALRHLGAAVSGLETPRGLSAPLTIRGPLIGDDVEVECSASSHALSALLLVAPLLPRGLTIRFRGPIASRPYIDLTCAVMRQHGVRVEREDGFFRVRAGGYGPMKDGATSIEGDWSSAAYMAAAGLVTGGEVHVKGAWVKSKLPDSRILKLALDFGGQVSRWDEDDEGQLVFVKGADRRPLDVDLRDAPDLAPLVGALGCVAEGTTRVRGAAHLRIKESDRIATVVAAARALGCPARELPDGFEIDGPARHGGLIATHHDHRIAMAFAVAGLAIPGVVIDDPACVAKSYPGFWRDLHSLLGSA